jgi:hypothetical protein
MVRDKITMSREDNIYPIEEGNNSVEAHDRTGGRKDVVIIETGAREQTSLQSVRVRREDA